MPGYRPSKIEESRESIILAGEKCELANEMQAQIQLNTKFTGIDLLNRHETSQSPLNLSAIIYFIGFGKSSLNQTIFSTQTLLSFLNLAHIRKCKFILIVGPDSTSTTKTSLLLANQFEQVSRVKLDVIQYQSNISFFDQAELILQKIIYKHRATIAKRTLPSPKNQSPVPAPKKFKKKVTNWLACSIVIGGIVGTFATLAVVSRYLLNQGVNNFQKFELLEAKSSFSAYKKIRFFDINNYFDFNTGTINSRQAIQIDGLLSLIFSEKKPAQLPKWEDTARTYLGEIKNQSILISNTFAPTQSTEKIQRLKSKVELIKNITEKSLLILPKLSTLFSDNQSKNVLFLIYDPNSPAPAGGKISGIVLVNLSSEKVTEAHYYSSRTIDNLFPGQLTSAEIYASASGQSQLAFSDLSYEPDTSKVMYSAANYVERSLLKKINFVISTNPNQLFQLINPTKTQDSLIQVSDSWLNMTVEKLNSMSNSEKLELMFSSLELLETKQLEILSLDPTVPELDIAEWSGRLQQTDCNSWLPCINQLIYPSFYLLDPSELTSPLKYSVEISNQISETNISSQLKLHLVNPQIKKSNLIFWLAHSGYLKIDQVKQNGIIIPPNSKKANYSPGISLNGYQLKLSSNSENLLEIDYSQNIPPGLDRFRYQFEFLGNPSETQALTANFRYPQSWQTVSHLTPTVASMGDLRYNVPLTSPKLVLEFIQK